MITAELVVDHADGSQSLYSVTGEPRFHRAEYELGALLHPSHWTVENIVIYPLDEKGDRLPPLKCEARRQLEHLAETSLLEVFHDEVHEGDR